MTEKRNSSPNPNNPVDDGDESTMWDYVYDIMPTWIDEVLSLLLVIFGILSLLSVFDVAGDAAIPRAWAGTLKSLFGYGSLIVSSGILTLGIVLILPNMGITVRFPIRRIIALEVTFLSSLALMHLMASGSVEMRAVARAGSGGGLVGWALSGPLSLFIGSATVITIYVILWLFSFGIVIGITQEQAQLVMRRIEKRFMSWSEHLAKTPHRNRERRRDARKRREVAAYHLARRYSLPDNQQLRTPVIRIRPNLDNIPPSLRPGAKPAPAIETSELDEDAPLFGGAGSGGESFNIIGDIIKDSKKKFGETRVQRPDGRIKRYFELGDISEPKKTGRRKKDYPSLELLQDTTMNRPTEEEINTKAVLIENTLLEFDIDIDVVGVRVGPTVTQYAVKPYREDDNENVQRTRISKIASYQNDLSLALSAKRLRIEAPVPGTNYVGIEVPNNDPSVVALRTVYESKAYYEGLQKAKTPLYIPLGRDVAGEPFSIDLAGLPHTLVAGTTGSGKSVCLAAMITALVLHNTPDDVRLIMLDPKMVELSRFNGLPHLLGPVETDGERILGVLRWCTREMDDRYRKLEAATARNISIYNDKERAKGKTGEPIPYIVIFIDEVGDLMMNNPDETEHHLTRLAQMARAVGIHLVVATQRPSVDVLTGLIKANFPGRIAFSVASQMDSRVIIDSSGAEALMGRGDMLFLSSDASGPRRLQGCFVSDDEVRVLVNYWRKWAKEKRDEGKLPEPETSVPWEKTLTKLELLSETDELLEPALEAIVRAREASTAMLQKHLNIGFPRASRIMDLLFELGAIGPPEAGGKMRRVLISSTRKDPMADLIEQQKEAAKLKERVNAFEAKMKAKPDEFADEDEDDDPESDISAED